MLPLPYRFGRYRLTKLLAVGGMAQIYIAKSFGAEGFVKPLVIKRLDPRLATDQRFTQLFVNEAKMLVSLNHGNIVPVFDFGRVDNDLYMAMEFIRGTSLRKLVQALAGMGQHLDVQVAAHITAEICKGLDYAHRKSDDRGRPAGIIHRDIKPSNILISREGEVKIVDFGVAKLAHRPSDRAFSGTVGYMSPEQANLQDVDSRTDIFSTGLVLYELLSLQAAYDGESAREVLELARRAEVPPLGDHVPSELAAIVERATAKAPEERYDAVHDMEHDLTEFMVLARSVGVTVDSEPMASKLSALLRQLPALSLDGPLFDDDTTAGPTEAGPLGPGREATSQTMELTGHGTEETQPPLVPGSTEEHSFAHDRGMIEPPDLALIRDAAETFHSEFISRIAPKPKPGAAPPVMTAERPLPRRRPHQVGRWVAIAAVLTVVFAAGVASTWILREERPSTPRAVGASSRAADLASPAPQDAKPPAQRAQRAVDAAPAASQHRVDAGASAAGRRPDARHAKSPRRKPQRYGYLNISSIPWSHVTIDGHRHKSPTPLMRLRLRAGVHTVVLENRARGLRKVLRVRIRPDQSVSKVVRLLK